ncbi:MAG: hypothetical protein KDA29_00410 [Phycisphaerales bacterium]|nr:hypothetical protein [Phycisphaerales bacterium]
MFLNIIVVILVLSIGYAWMNRGIFNAMLHTLCALAAGAIAFAVWEPLSVMLVNASPERGFFSFLEGAAWGVSLVIPFVVAFILLRVISDKVVPNNIKNSRLVDYIGGAAFGLVTGIISIGILVIGVGNMRLPTNFLGYQPLWYSADRATGAGSLVKTDKLWIPVDSLVATVYGKLSNGAMSTSQPLAYWYPELRLTGFASRVSPEGAARNAMRIKDFNMRGTYTVGPDEGAQMSELLKLDGNSTQRYVDINNEPVSAGKLYGYVIEFEAGAKERGEKGAGQLIISNGHVRMLVENSDGSTETIFPAAVISESSNPGEFGRWRFDANDVYVSSTGGSSKVPMGFEFVVPSGSTPVALYVKNLRVDTAELPKPVNYRTASRRDLSVRSGAILKGKGDEVTYNSQNAVTVAGNDPNSDYLTTSPRMLEVLAISVARRGLTVDDDNEIVGGQGTYDVKEEAGRRNAPTSKNLRVERYGVGEGQTLIKLDVSAGSPFGFLSTPVQTAPLDQPLRLLDTNGNEYEAIGYEYIDNTNYEVRYTRGSTLTGIEDTPSLSTTRDDQKLLILFIVTKGVEIDRFVIDDMVIAKFSPVIETQE